MVVPSRLSYLFSSWVSQAICIKSLYLFGVVLNRWLRMYTLIVGVIISDHWRSLDEWYINLFSWWIPMGSFWENRRGNHIRNGHDLTWRFVLHKKQAEIGWLSRTSVLVSNLGFLSLALWLIGHSVFSLCLSLTCTWWSSVSLSVVSVRTRSSVSLPLWCSCLAGEISRRLHIHWKVSSLRCCGWAV